METDLVNQLIEIAQSLNYAAKLEPEKGPCRLFGWFRERELHPDIRVKNGDRSAIVTVKPRLLTVHDVLLAHKAGQKIKARILMCVPDGRLEDIRPSAWDYAKDMNVHICSISGAGQKLQAMLD